MARRARSCALLALRVWKKFVRLQSKQRGDFSRAQCRHNSRLVWLLWASWAWQVRARRKHRRMLLAREAQRALAVQQSSLSNWSARAAQRRAIRRYHARLTMGLGQSRLRAVLAAWLAAVAEEGRLYRLCVKALALIRRKDLALSGRALREWAARVFELKGRRLLPQWCKVLLPHRGWTSIWHGCHVARRGVRAYLERMAGCVEIESVGLVLGQWASYTHDHKGRKHACNSATKRIRAIQSARVFGRWRGHTVEHARDHRFYRKVAHTRRMLVTVQTWSSWLRNMRFFRRCRAVLQRLLNLQLIRALHCWHENASEQRHARRVCTRVVQCLRQGLIARAWQTWSSVAKTESRVQKTARKVLFRFCNQLLTTALETWAAHAREQKASFNICRKVILRIQNTLLAGVFSLWTSWASEQKRMRTVCSRVIRHLVNRGLCVAFNRWAEQAGEQRQMANKCHTVLQRLLNLQLIRALHCWHENASEQRRVVTKCRMVLSRILNSHLAQAWNTWRANAAGHRALVHQSRSRVLNRSWRTWRLGITRTRQIQDWDVRMETQAQAWRLILAWRRWQLFFHLRGWESCFRASPTSGIYREEYTTLANVVYSSR